MAHQGQHVILIIILFLFVLIMGVLIQSDASIFENYFGDLNPWVVTFLVPIIGYLTLNALCSKGRFAIFKYKYPIRVLPYFFIVTLFTAVAILVDLKRVYPADMNIPFPESLLFYPAIGFLVEIVFHVLPLVLLVFILNLVSGMTTVQRWIWVAFLVVAILEPTYQVYMDPYPPWALSVVWINLFLFNVLQLFVFYRFDFVSMFALRMVYYLIWHIVWGALRLEILF